VTENNIDELPDVARFAKEHMTPIKLTPCFSYFGNLPIKPEHANLLKECAREPYVHVDTANLELVKRGGNDTKKPMCRAMSSCIVISPDNHLMLPCFHKCTKQMKINGNLFELYNSPEVRTTMKQEGSWDFCRGCTIYCYMRSSFYKSFPSKYFFEFLKSNMHLARELMRKQF
jgi:hypothetical protein